MVNKVKLYNNFNIINNHKKSILLIGNFDGMHLGHKRIIKKVQDIANQNKIKSVILTFSPHTKKILNNDPEYKTLSNFSIKSEK